MHDIRIRGCETMEYNGPDPANPNVHSAGFHLRDGVDAVTYVITQDQGTGQPARKVTGSIITMLSDAGAVDGMVSTAQFGPMQSFSVPAGATRSVSR